MFTALINVRFADEEDGVALSEIFAQSWQGAYQGILPHKDLTLLIAKRDGAWWSEAVLRRHILVVEFENKIVGYAQIGPNRKPGLELKAEGEISELYILPLYQGLGLGTRLFEESRNFLYLRGYDGLIVWALSENVIASNFYHGKGGAPVAQSYELFSGRKVHKIAYLWEEAAE